jgi:cytochrome P450
VLAGGTSINGEHYPAGVVSMPNWAMRRNKGRYGDAYIFRPERWIVSDELESFNPEEDVRRLRRGLHTFLKGPGDCVGRKLPMLQISILIARILWRMDVRLAPGADAGAGNAKLGWGQSDPWQYVVGDAYIGLH